MVGWMSFLVSIRDFTFHFRGSSENHRYKNHRVDGKVTAVWAGSAITYQEMIDTIRPEDFDIRYRSKNRFRFLGNGKSKLEATPGSDLAYYVYK